MFVMELMRRLVMLTAHSPYWPPRVLQSFGPEDISAMCFALKRACDENQVDGKDSQQREDLAKVILVKYRPDMDESELVAAAIAIAGRAAA
jgi:hypothetical protein